VQSALAVRFPAWDLRRAASAAPPSAGAASSAPRDRSPAAPSALMLPPARRARKAASSARATSEHEVPLPVSLGRPPISRLLLPLVFRCLGTPAPSPPAMAGLSTPPLPPPHSTAPHISGEAPDLTPHRGHPPVSVSCRCVKCKPMSTATGYTEGPWMLKKDGTCAQCYDDCEKCNPEKTSQCLKCRVSVPRQRHPAPQLLSSTQPAGWPSGLRRCCRCWAAAFASIRCASATSSCACA
jgi:hypothetical protein